MKGDFWKVLFKAVPIPLLLVDGDVNVIMLNPAAKEFLKDTEMRRPFGELFNCARAVAKGCGQSEKCKDCVVRKSVKLALSGRTVVRQRVSQTRIVEGQRQKLELLITASAFQGDGHDLVVVAIEDITELAQLRKIIPICMHCKRIRNDRDFWQAVDDFINEHYGLEFSHGLCPECARKYYPEIFNKQGPPDEF